MERALTLLPSTFTRRYNTKKANWSDFGRPFIAKLEEFNISESIRKSRNSEDLEVAIQSYTNIIHEVCFTTIPRAAPWKRNPIPPWWNKALGDL